MKTWKNVKLFLFTVFLPGEKQKPMQISCFLRVRWPKALIYSVFEWTILAQTDFTFKMARRKRKRGKKDGDAAEDATEHEMGEGEDAPMPKKGTGKGKDKGKGRGKGKGKGKGKTKSPKLQ